MRKYSYFRAFKDCKRMVAFFCFVFVVFFFIGVTKKTARAEMYSLSGDAENGYYYNLPVSGVGELVIPDDVKIFKIYDDGGRDREYSFGCDATLTFTAPENCLLYITGTVSSEASQDQTQLYDFVALYDGDDSTSSYLGLKSQYGGMTDSIGTLTTTGNQVTLYFHTDGYVENETPYDGIDFTVRVLKKDARNAIRVTDTNGGSVQVTIAQEEVMEAGAHETVNVVATPEQGYDLVGIEVTDDYGNNIFVEGGFWYTDSTAIFQMPCVAVNINAIFQDVSVKENYLSYDIPFSGLQELTVAKDVCFFKIYDNGGGEGEYADYSDGFLLLTVPEGFVMKITGSVKSEGHEYDYLSIFDGTSEEDDILGSQECYGTQEGESVSTLVSSGNKVLINFKSDGGYVYDGVDLTVKLIDMSKRYSIEIDDESIHKDARIFMGKENVVAAPEGQMVSVSFASPKGYILDRIDVTDGMDVPLDVIGGTWQDNNTGTFRMPASDVVIYPSFVPIKSLERELSVHMPVSGLREITLSNETRIMKVFDDGGFDKPYSDNCNGSLLITVPEGYRIQLSGMVITEENEQDYLAIYDGPTDKDPFWLETEKFSSKDGITLEPALSTGDQILLNFVTDYSITYEGVDLTIALVPIEYDITYDLADGYLEDGNSNPTKYTRDTEDIILVQPKRPGYIFNGWMGTDLENTSKEVTIPEGSMGDRVYNATWRMLLTNEDVDIKIQQPQYTGEVFGEIVSVRNGETLLVKGKDYTVTYKLDGQVVNNPYEAKDYDVIIEGIGNYIGVVEKKISVSQRELTIPSVIARDRVYDGTNMVVINEVVLSGICGSDDVRIDMTNLQGVLESANHGTYTMVTLGSLTLIGEDANNYRLTQTTGSFNLYPTVTIEKETNAPGLPDCTKAVSFQVKTVSDIELPKDWKWQEADQSKVLQVDEVTTATAVYEGMDKGNYYNEEVVISITRKSCNHAGQKEVRNKKQATCGVLGYSGDSHCMDCGQMITKGTELAKTTTHIWDEGVVTKPAMALQKGERLYTCIVCKTTKKEEIVALGAPKVNTTITDDTKTALYKITKSDLKTGTVAYVSPVNKKAKTVIIPKVVTIDNVEYKVTSIEEKAFKKSKITKVTIGDSVQIIRKSAFEGCKSLKTVTIGKTVTTMEDKAFYGCSKLKQVEIKSTKLKDKKIKKNAFGKTPKTLKIKVPKSAWKKYKKFLYKKGINKKAKITK